MILFRVSSTLTLAVVVLVAGVLVLIVTAGVTVMFLLWAFIAFLTKKRD